MTDENIKEEENQVVFPGDELVESMDILPGFGTFRDGNKIYAKVTGILRKNGSVMSVIPLAGVYMPKSRDYVIGEIKVIGFSHWSVDIGSPYDASMSIVDTNEYIERNADLSKYYSVGDLIFAKVVSVTQTKFINVSMKDPKARKLIGGLVTKITPTKVPRLIGKAGSMINIIKDKTNCYITVGQNGLVWMKGEHADIAAEAVELVDKQSHMLGLTDRITKMLDKKLGEKK